MRRMSTVWWMPLLMLLCLASLSVCNNNNRNNMVEGTSPPRRWRLPMTARRNKTGGGGDGDDLWLVASSSSSSTTKSSDRPRRPVKTAGEKLKEALHSSTKLGVWKSRKEQQQQEQEEPSSNDPPTEKRGWFSRNRNETKTEESSGTQNLTTQSDSEDKPNDNSIQQETPKRSWLHRLRQKKVVKQDGVSDASDQAEKEPEPAESGALKNVTGSAESSTEKDTTNSTSNTSPSLAQQPIQGPILVRLPHPSHQLTPQQHLSRPINEHSVVMGAFLVKAMSNLYSFIFSIWLARHYMRQLEEVHPTQHFVWERLNDLYSKDDAALSRALQAPPKDVSHSKWYRQHTRKVLARKQSETPKWNEVFTRTVVVMDLTQVGFDMFTQAVSFLIQQYEKGAFGRHKQSKEHMELEVVVLINSPGGPVATFGLVAAQLQRLSATPGITTTVCVDQVAASGGYMIASQAHRLIAAPFASLGSIGVMLGVLNYHDMAQKYGIQPLYSKAGENKNPINAEGKVTPRDIREAQRNLDKLHEAFRTFVATGRPGLVDSMNVVGDGSVFLGLQALELGMVDAIMTSEAYVMDRVRAHDRVLRLQVSHQARMPRSMRSLRPWDLFSMLKGLTGIKLRLPDQATRQEILAKVVQAGSYLVVAHQLFQAVAKQ